MAGKNIITINGRSYDAASGRPIVAMPKTHAGDSSKPRPEQPKHRAFSDISGPSRLQTPPAKRVVHAEVKAHTVHQKPQKSQTLYRAALKKPELVQQTEPLSAAGRNDAPANANHQRSPIISKFGPSFQAPEAKTSPSQAVGEQPDKAPQIHPVVTKALAKHAAPAQPATSRELKENLIRERLAEAQPNRQAPHSKHHRHFRGQPKLATILTSSLALLLLAGYLTYINLPNISMRVAAVRAGISANYPNYSPDGYHFAGPITYQPGEVNITFKSNTNDHNFIIKQKASSWDSQAVLDNYVSKKTGTYLTYQERGLTIYSFGNKAAWVNGGLLYTIEGDAPLSSDQLLKIATSM